MHPLFSAEMTTNRRSMTIKVQGAGGEGGYRSKNATNSTVIVVVVVAGEASALEKGHFY